MTHDFEKPLARLQLLATGIAAGGLLLGAILMTLGATKIGLWSLTFNVGLLLVLFGVAGARIFSLAREVVSDHHPVS